MRICEAGNSPENIPLDTYKTKLQNFLFHWQFEQFSHLIKLFMWKYAIRLLSHEQLEKKFKCLASHFISAVEISSQI